MSSIVLAVIALVGGMTSGGIVSVAKVWFDARAKARTDARTAAAAPLTERELAQLPEIERLRRQCDELLRKAESLYARVAELSGEAARAAGLASAMTLRAEAAEAACAELTRERDALRAERDGAVREREQMRVALVQANGDLDAERERVSAVGRTDATGRHRPLGER